MGRRRIKDEEEEGDQENPWKIALFHWWFNLEKMVRRSREDFEFWVSFCFVLYILASVGCHLRISRWSVAVNIVTSGYQICLDAVRRWGGYYMEVLLLVLHGWDSAVSTDIYSSVGPTLGIQTGWNHCHNFFYEKNIKIMKTSWQKSESCPLLKNKCFLVTPGILNFYIKSFPSPSWYSLLHFF